MSDAYARAHLTPGEPAGRMLPSSPMDRSQAASRLAPDATRRALALGAVGAVAALLAACGRRGDLELPDHEGPPPPRVPQR